MHDSTHHTEASNIMALFACKTGLSPTTRKPQRYLWTDAFAVCNFLGAYRRTGEDKHLRLALEMVKQVHETLGKHRKDDPRSGWISGLEECAGGLHPTIGGLRIGKKLGERNINQPYDELLEWDRDGQYYHYLTKWMHALHQVTMITGDPVFNQWAWELATTAHSAFVHHSRTGTPSLYWKMNIDLTRPLVPSMGQHDPLDGYLTCHEIHRLSVCRSGATPHCDLTAEIADLAEMCGHSTWTTDDPLGIGGLLFDAYRISQLMVDEVGFEDHNLLPEVLQSSITGLHAFLTQGALKVRPEQRIAFRELGLAIGLHAIPLMHALLRDTTGLESGDVVTEQLNELMALVPLAESIETFWLRPASRQFANWQAHENINMVMLATTQKPPGVLRL